jgi:hypothetical protein
MDVLEVGSTLVRSVSRLRRPKTSVNKRTRFYDDPPEPNVSTAILYKRASLFPIECIAPTKIKNVDFVWVHADFALKISLDDFLGETDRCATKQFRWILADRLVRPLSDPHVLRQIADRVSRQKPRIRKSTPRPFICPDPIIEDADDFVTKCSKLTQLRESVEKLIDWGLDVPRPKWPDWMAFAEHPVHESIDAQITIVCDCDPDEILWDSDVGEYVRAFEKPKWTRLGKGWTTPRLRELNTERKNTSKKIEREFEIAYERHKAEALDLGKRLVELDEECFYGSYDYAYPEFGDRIETTHTMTSVELARAVYLAQCGFPVPLRSTIIYKWFDVSETEPNDGIFSSTKWAHVREKLIKKWGEPFVL